MLGWNNNVYDNDLCWVYDQHTLAVARPSIHPSIWVADVVWGDRQDKKNYGVALQNGIGYGRDFIIMSEKWFLDIYEIRFDIQMCAPQVHEGE